MSPPPPVHRPRRVRAGLALVTLLLALAALPAAARADACTAPVASPVACENTKPGVPAADWQVGAGDNTIQGFSTRVSVDKGQPVSFKITSATAGYHVDILRLGYYGGDGARMIAPGLAPASTAAQPQCDVQSGTGLIDCGRWSVSLTWTVPSTAVSGVYIARLVRDDTGGASLIPFVVRDDASHSQILLQTADSTWAAYNVYGGNNLYQCQVGCPPGNPGGYKGASKVSYNKPFTTAGYEGPVLFYAEYPMIRFMEANGYDVSYIAEVDVHRQGSLLLDHRLFVSSGHDEYWSASQRSHVEAARDAGVNLAFFGGNSVFWKTRWEPSIDGTGTADRTLVSYKDTHYDAPTDPVEWTGTWRDPRFSPPADGGRPENALMGQAFLVNQGTTEITVPSQFRALRAWRNTDVAALGAGQSKSLAWTSLGYEWDLDFDNEFRPPGTFQLSSTTVAAPQVFFDYGTDVTPLTETHNMTMYRAASGARVFSTGTVNWARGLDNFSSPGIAESTDMQQMTVNVFADMGAQPATLGPGLVPASASTDASAPSSAITSPTGGSVADGATVTVSGTAADSGGGVVAGVEVSTDGGASWHRASGTTSWSYAWKAHGTPSTTLRSRAVDDSGNLGTASAPVSVNVACPCTILGTTAPPDPDAGDANAVELGVRFTTELDGQIAGVRFYKSSGNTGTHVGSLWTAGGTRLAQATFTGESATGWQTATFATPVSITAGTTYVASYFAPRGHYAATPLAMYRPPAPTPGMAELDSPPLHVVRNSGGATNGVFDYTLSGTFPTSSFRATNYWVDVVFQGAQATTIPGQVTGVTATAGPGSATVSWTAPATGGLPSSYVVTPRVNGVAQTPRTVTGSPLPTTTTVSGLAAGTAYTFTVAAVNAAGTGPASTPSAPVTPTSAGVPGAPTAVAAAPASASAQVSWTAPASDGGSAITGYLITPYAGTTAQTPVTTTTPATSATVTGLDDGTAYTFTVRAANAVGTGPASAPSAAVTPQGTIFDLATPAIADSADGNAVELGVKFTAAVNGRVSGVRFYKAAANTGTHTGSLWTAAGTRLAQATFTGETASGWQSALFTTPVTITAGTTYVASYHAPAGHYSLTSGGLASAVTNGPLTALASSTSPNGVFAYGASSSFPDGSYKDTNYFADVIFQAAPAGAVPGQATNVSASAGSGSATVSWTAPATGGTPTSYVVTPRILGVPQTPKTVTGSPPATSTTVTGLTAGLPYTFTVTAANANGSGTASEPSNSVTPTGGATAPGAPTAVTASPATASARVGWTAPASDGGSAITGYTITPFVGASAQAPVQAAASARTATVGGLTNGTGYTFTVRAVNAVGPGPASAASADVTPAYTIFDFATPATVDVPDGNAVELGVKFTAASGGTVTGIRFHKAAANTGTHTGSLWTTTGTRLAQATFTGETATGWQTATFSTPVSISAGTTYVASYHAPAGHYSVTGGGLASAVTNGPLTALADSTSPDGVYVYGPTSAFPVSSYNSSDYGVDVLFLPVAGNPPGQVTNVSASAGSGSATVSWTAPSSGGTPTSYVVTPRIGGVAQTPKTVTGSPPATGTTVTGLSAGTAYTFTVTAANANGSGTASEPSNSVTPTGATVPGAPTGATARRDTKSALVSWTAPAGDGGSAITGYTITPFVGTTAQTAVSVGASVTGTRVTGLTNGTSYTFTVMARNAVGTGPASSPTAAVVPASSLFDFATPAVADAGDRNAVNLGVKFTAATAGTVVGARFYKAIANTGTHPARLWSATGTLLAQATFAGETASGWQSVLFPTPVAITANTTYVVSYLAPNGHYAATSNAFSSSIANPPLTALANATSPNGVYVYGSTSAFPTSAYQATNYHVDVLFSAGGA